MNRSLRIVLAGTVLLALNLAWAGASHAQTDRFDALATRSLLSRAIKARRHARSCDRARTAERLHHAST